MATWGQFIAEVPIIKIKPGVIHVLVDDVMTLWDERNSLREEVARLKAGEASPEPPAVPAVDTSELDAEIDRLKAELLNEREACAREVEELAEAFLQEQSDQTEHIVTVLQAAASLIRERGSPEGDVPMAETIEHPESVESEAAEIPLAAPVEESPPLAALEEHPPVAEPVDAPPPLAHPVESAPPMAEPVEAPAPSKAEHDVPHPEFRFE